jgi:hypothetical protein
MGQVPGGASCQREDDQRQEKRRVAAGRTNDQERTPREQPAARHQKSPAPAVSQNTPDEAAQRACRLHDGQEHANGGIVESKVMANTWESRREKAGSHLVEEDSPQEGDDEDSPLGGSERETEEETYYLTSTVSWLHDYLLSERFQFTR